MQTITRNKLIPAGLVLAVVLFIIVSIISLTNVRQLTTTHAQTEHFHQIIAQLSMIDTQIRVAEDSKRGYLITGQPEQLAPYFEAEQQLALALSNLHELVGNNAELQAQLNELAPLLQGRLDLIEQVIDTRDNVSFEAAAQIVQQGTGEKLMNEILDMLQVMDNDQDEALAQLLEQTANQTQTALLAISGSIILGLVVLVGSLYLLRTEMRQRTLLTKTLQQQTVELENRNRDLDAFAQMVAHDLKNPVSVMVGIADILASDHNTLPRNTLQEYLRSIARSGHKANEIIESLLLLAGLRKADIQLQPLDMAKIIAEVQQDLAKTIEAYQGEIIVPSDWPAALGYAPWVEQVWVNYISNGLKYGGQPPRIELGATVLPDGRVRYWVHDNGPGLSPAQQEKLFSPFIRLAPARANGHGVGLSIVQEMVVKMGGQVGVDSDGKPGWGCTFNFTLSGLTEPVSSQS